MFHASPGQVARVGGQIKWLQCPHTYNPVHDPNTCVQCGIFVECIGGRWFCLGEGHGGLSRGRHLVALCMVHGVKGQGAGGGEVSIRSGTGSVWGGLAAEHIVT